MRYSRNASDQHKAASSNAALRSPNASNDAATRTIALAWINPYIVTWRAASKAGRYGPAPCAVVK